MRSSRRVFHVGVQEELSVSVAVPFYTYPDMRLLAFSVLPELTSEVVAARAGALDDPSAMHRLAAGPGVIAERMGPGAGELLATLGEAMRERLPALLDGRWQALLSNGGWEVVAADLARQDATPTDVEKAVAAGTVVRLRRPFQVRHDSGGSLYLRGSQVAVPDDISAEDLAEAADQLNNGGSLVASQDPGLLGALRALAGTGGLLIEPPDAGTEER
jgi:hypothetical protein